MRSARIADSDTAWTRLVDPTITQMVHAVSLVAIAVGGVLFTIAVLSGSPVEPRPGDDALLPDRPVLRALAVYALLGAMATVAWRAMTVGLYTTGTALRIRYVFHTVSVPWCDVVAVRSAPSMVLGSPDERHAIWLSLRSGTQIETMVQNRRRVTPFGLHRRGLSLREREYRTLLGVMRRYRRANRPAADDAGARSPAANGPIGATSRERVRFSGPPIVAWFAVLYWRLFLDGSKRRSRTRS